MANKKVKIAVLISGNGSNLQALIDACAIQNATENNINAKDVHSQQQQQQPTLGDVAEIALVVSNRKDAYGLIRAQKAGIPTLYKPLKPYLDAGKSRTDYDRDLALEIKNFDANGERILLIVLAGWMHILSPQFLSQFPTNSVVNLHPALPHQFNGTHAIERAFNSFQKGEISHTGVMVHYVIEEVDEGEVIQTADVPIYKEDTLDDLERRMHETEHKIIVDAVRKVCLQRLQQ